jgi:hypothetical protein
VIEVVKVMEVMVVVGDGRHMSLAYYVEQRQSRAIAVTLMEQTRKQNQQAIQQISTT